MSIKEMVVMRADTYRGPGTKRWEEVPSPTILSELDTSEGAADEYSCPVCGIELTRSNFVTPERDYYCPFCSTRQTPSVVRVVAPEATMTKP